ncbi:MAG: MBL fold metallo-hydrolase [Bacteroidota bacterium]
MKVKFWLQCAGYCLAHKHFALRGSKREEISFPATYGVIRHPEKGWILFDTGYTDRFFQETKSFPGKLYSMMTPVFVDKAEEAINQIQKLGIEAKDVEHIIISHFHADHVGGLKDFPYATFYCTAKALEIAKNYKGLAAVRRGVLPGLLPADFFDRVKVVDQGAFPTRPHDIFGETVDLWGDGSILLPYLPGHAAGQMGGLFQTDQGEVLMTADAAWLKENFQLDVLPSPIVKLFFDSWEDFTESLSKVRRYWQAHPQAHILPTHCQATYTSFVEQQN